MRLKQYLFGRVVATNEQILERTDDLPTVDDTEIVLFGRVVDDRLSCWA
jgi:hypothetical protein